MEEFLARSLDASTIFTIAALGELIGQRSGVINVGVEGVMLFGATLGFIAAQSTGNYLIGFAIAIAIGALLGLLHGFFSITLGGDQVVSGMGIWILGLRPVSQGALIIGLMGSRFECGRADWQGGLYTKWVGLIDGWFVVLVS